MRIRFFTVFLTLILEIILAYFIVPTDLYHHPNVISIPLQDLTTFLVKNNLRFFPGSLILIFQGQKFLGLCRFLINTHLLVLLFVLPIVFRRLSTKKFISMFLVGSLVVFLEIAVHLTGHNFDQMIITPLVIILLFFGPIKKYFLLLLLASLLLTFDFWSIYLKDLIYNHLYLFFVPVNIFENLNIFLFITAIIYFFNLKRLFFPLVACYLIVTVAFSKQEKWIWTKVNSNDQYLIFEKDFYLPRSDYFTVTANITAKSSYKLYINDQFIGLGPGPIDDKRRFWDEYVLPKYLFSGKNRIKIVAYNFGHDTHFQKKQDGGVLFSLRFKLGPIEILLPTDGTWIVKEQTGWQKIDPKSSGIKDFEINSGLYREDYNFNEGLAKRFFVLSNNVARKDNLTKRDLPPLIFEKDVPCTVDKNDDALWIDFGKMIVGYPVFTIKTIRPETIQIHYYEDFQSDMVQEDNLILPSGGEYIHEIFGRRGFRFMKITSNSKKIPVINVYVKSVHLSIKKIAEFESSDEQLNNIYHLGANTLQLAMQNEFEDSFVHERSQYLGDAYIDMLSGFYSFNPQTLAKKALYQFASTQQLDGTIETVYPSSLGQTILSYNLQFAPFLKDYFLYTNDTKTIRDLLPMAKKINAALEKMINQDSGLLDLNKTFGLKLGKELTGWVDHTAEGDPGPDTFLVINSQYLMQLGALSYFEPMFQQKTAAFRQKLHDFIRQKGWVNIEPHAAITIINAGALSTPEEKELYESVLKNPARPFITGYFNLFYLKAIRKIEDEEGIKKLLAEHWGGMIANGAVTTWETFDPRTQKVSFVSKTHAWSSGPTYFLPAFIAGVRPLDPGYKSIIIEPMFLTDKIKLNLETAEGKIKMAWNKLPNKLEIFVEKDGPKQILFRLSLKSSAISGVFLNDKEIVPEFINNQLVIRTELDKVDLSVDTL